MQKLCVRFLVVCFPVLFCLVKFNRRPSAGNMWWQVAFPFVSQTGGEDCEGGGGGVTRNVTYLTSSMRFSSLPLSRRGDNRALNCMGAPPPPLPKRTPPPLRNVSSVARVVSFLVVSCSCPQVFYSGRQDGNVRQRHVE